MGKYGKGLTLAFFLCSMICHAQDGGAAMFPHIARLDSRDDGYKQYIADVESNRRRVFNRGRESAAEAAASLTVYQYTPREGEDIFFLAARCNIPYAALASLNRLNHPLTLEAGKPLLLPSTPGVFVPEEPRNDLERLLASSRSAGADNAAKMTIGAAFYFFPGDEFSTTERAFFLNRGFSFPLHNYRLTSGFGMRQNPVTGNMRVHEGLDLAAPMGTEVFAAGDGIVTDLGNDPVYGNYIVIKHAAGWASLYGHLQRTGVTLQSSVKSGTLIGWVGSTGQSTGPHLHFELRQDGKARDPGKLLFLPGGR